jgi:hypothetical protein
MKQLCRFVHVWPPQDQPNTIGSKLQLIENLDTIASSFTCSAGPVTRALLDGQNFPANIVLKRTHSDTGYHILMPFNKEHAPKRTWDYLRSSVEIPGSVWFGQTYVRYLEVLGEWRVFIVGGRIVYTVHTLKHPTKKTWQWDIARAFYSLEDLTYERMISFLHIHRI